MSLAGNIYICQSATVTIAVLVSWLRLRLGAEPIKNRLVSQAHSKPEILGVSDLDMKQGDRLFCFMMLQREVVPACLSLSFQFKWKDYLSPRAGNCHLWARWVATSLSIAYGYHKLYSRGESWENREVTGWWQGYDVHALIAKSDVENWVTDLPSEPLHLSYNLVS